MSSNNANFSTSTVRSTGSSGSTASSTGSSPTKKNKKPIKKRGSRSKVNDGMQTAAATTTPMHESDAVSTTSTVSSPPLSPISNGEGAGLTSIAHRLNPSPPPASSIRDRVRSPPPSNNNINGNSSASTKSPNAAAKVGLSPVTVERLKARRAGSPSPSPKSPASPTPGGAGKVKSPAKTGSPKDLPAVIEDPIAESSLDMEVVNQLEQNFKDSLLINAAKELPAAPAAAVAELHDSKYDQSNNATFLDKLEENQKGEVVVEALQFAQFNTATETHEIAAAAEAVAEVAAEVFQEFKAALSSSVAERQQEQQQNVIFQSPEVEAVAVVVEQQTHIVNEETKSLIVEPVSPPVPATQSKVAAPKTSSANQKTMTQKLLSATAPAITQALSALSPILAMIQSRPRLAWMLRWGAFTMCLPVLVPLVLLTWPVLLGYRLASEREGSLKFRVKAAVRGWLQGLADALRENAGPQPTSA